MYLHYIRISFALYAHVYTLVCFIRYATHSRTVPGWCGDEGEGDLVIQKPPKHTEMKEN